MDVPRARALRAAVQRLGDPTAQQRRREGADRGAGHRDRSDEREGPVDEDQAGERHQGEHDGHRAAARERRGGHGDGTDRHEDHPGPQREGRRRPLPRLRGPCQEGGAGGRHDGGHQEQRPPGPRHHDQLRQARAYDRGHHPHRGQDGEHHGAVALVDVAVDRGVDAPDGETATHPLHTARADETQGRGAHGAACCAQAEESRPQRQCRADPPVDEQRAEELGERVGGREGAVEAAQVEVDGDLGYQRGQGQTVKSGHEHDRHEGDDPQPVSYPQSSHGTLLPAAGDTSRWVTPSHVKRDSR